MEQEMTSRQRMENFSQKLEEFHPEQNEEVQDPKLKAQEELDPEIEGEAAAERIADAFRKALGHADKKRIQISQNA
jgi:hypothetical protein